MRETKNMIIDLSHKLTLASQNALDYATQKHADRAKISASCAIEKRLVVENKEFTLANTLETQKVAVGVHKDQKKGSASLNNYNANALRSSVDDALALARFSVADEFLIMPDSAEAPVAESLAFMWDDRTSDVSLGDLQELTQAMLSRLTADKRVSLDRLEVSTSSMWHGLYNSRGVKQSEMQTAISWSFMGMAVDGAEVSGFDYDGRSIYAWDGALDVALRQCDAFVDKILKNLRPVKAPTYKGTILMTPRAVEEILLGTILYHMSGASVMDGKSQWYDKIGRNVISNLISLTDAPHNPAFSGATAFDGDGLPTANRDLIKNGVLMTHLHDCYSAHRCKVKSTHTAGGPFALMCSPGSGLLKDMMNARSEMLVVDRFSGNIDPIKGDFSGVAKSSRSLKNGVDQGAVGETMIAGNLFECLNNILTVSTITQDVSGSMRMPWMVVDGVSVTGQGG
jgi:PmbA protein